MVNLSSLNYWNIVSNLLKDYFYLLLKMNFEFMKLNTTIKEKRFIFIYKGDEKK